MRRATNGSCNQNAPAGIERSAGGTGGMKVYTIIGSVNGTVKGSSVPVWVEELRAYLN